MLNTDGPLLALYPSVAVCTADGAQFTNESCPIFSVDEQLAGFTGVLTVTVANPAIAMGQLSGSDVDIQATGTASSNGTVIYHPGKTTITITDSGTHSSVVIPVQVVGASNDTTNAPGSFMATDTTPAEATLTCKGNTRQISFEAYSGGIAGLTATSTTSGFSVTAGPASGEAGTLNFNVNFTGTLSGFVHAKFDGNEVYYPYEVTGAHTAAAFGALGCP